jgi:hypothetical protein
VTAAVRAAAVIGLMALVTVAPAADSPGDGAREQAAALAKELELHPEANGSDVYKFLHQGVFGPGHAVDDRDSAAAYLEQEIAGLGPAPVEEPLCQALGGPIPMVRIHLRPYLAAGHDPSALVDAFVASAATQTGDAPTMDSAVEAAVAFLAKRGLWGIAGKLQDLAPALSSQGYPAAHHSDRYAELYRPAYRVVRLDLARAKGWCAEAAEAER